MLATIVFLCLSAALGLAACFLPLMYWVFAAILGGLAALAAWSSNRAPTSQKTANGDVSNASIRSPALASLSVILLLANAIIVFSYLARAREASVSTVTQSNLNSLGQAIAMYRELHHHWPKSLDELIADDLTSPMQLFSILDPAFSNYSEFSKLEKLDTSFEYRRLASDEMNDGRFLVAWEREAWSPLSFKLFPSYGRWVLFGDGAVRRLDDIAFKTALNADRIARQRTVP